MKDSYNQYRKFHLKMCMVLEKLRFYMFDHVLSSKCITLIQQLGRVFTSNVSSQNLARQRINMPV